MLPPLSIALELKQELFFMASVREMPDLAGTAASICPRHEYQPKYAKTTPKWAI